MPKKYNQIKPEERDKIAVYLARNFTISDIARMLGRNRSSILREIKRNATAKRQSYTAMQAQKISDQRKSSANQHERIKDRRIREYIDLKLVEGFSPELISGRIKIDHPNLKISSETIYQYIYVLKPELKKYLARSHRKRQKRSRSTQASVNRIPSRISIDQRPDEINQRTKIGDWEADSVVSRQSKRSLAVVLERTSRFLMLTKIKRNGSKEFSKALIDMLHPIASRYRRSITYDNGKENMNHVNVNQQLETQSFFCNPYHSWEKGSIEQAIGLIRRYLPKKINFANVSHDQLTYIQHQLNSRPRKCLNFKTPYEVFSVALRH
jgi:transposase, IS30 family